MRDPYHLSCRFATVLEARGSVIFLRSDVDGRCVHFRDCVEEDDWCRLYKKGVCLQSQRFIDAGRVLHSAVTVR